MVPIQTRMIDPALLSESEIVWLDAYHQSVWENMSVYLSDEEKLWLQAQTKSLMEQNSTG